MTHIHFILKLHLLSISFVSFLFVLVDLGPQILLFEAYLLKLRIELLNILCRVVGEAFQFPFHLCTFANVAPQIVEFNTLVSHHLLCLSFGFSILPKQTQTI